MERALADSAPDHPDIAWRPPAELPPAADLERALAILQDEGRTSETHVATCFARLVMAFEPNTKLTAEQTRLRLAVWLEANGDLGDALWSAATLEAIRSATWMPRPAEFRKLVQDRLDERARRVRRCRAMIEARRTAGRPQPFQREPFQREPFRREPEPVRVRTSRDVFRRLGNIVRAAHYERRLAELERRPPENWAKEEATPEAAR